MSFNKAQCIVQKVLNSCFKTISLTIPSKIVRVFLKLQINMNFSWNTVHVSNRMFTLCFGSTIIYHVNHNEHFANRLFSLNSRFVCSSWCYRFERAANKAWRLCASYESTHMIFYACRYSNTIWRLYNVPINQFV